MQRDNRVETINDGMASGDESTDGYAPAARVASLAEAGYLVSVLQSEGLDAEVRHTKSFSAINGAWLTDYIVQAPVEQLPRVAQVLRAEAAAIAEEEDDAEAATDENDEFRQVVWRPVALMALAGVVSFLVGQHLATAPQREGENALSEAFVGVGRPFYTESGPGGVRHRLTYDRRAARWLLDTDVNGDGRFDQRRRFTTTPAVVADER